MALTYMQQRCIARDVAETGAELISVERMRDRTAVPRTAVFVELVEGHEHDPYATTYTEELAPWFDSAVQELAEECGEDPCELWKMLSPFASFTLATWSELISAHRYWQAFGIELEDMALMADQLGSVAEAEAALHYELSS